MLVAMAWRNLWRHGRRTLITAAALGVSLAFVMAMLCLMDGMYRKMSAIMIDQATGHVQVAHPAWAKSKNLVDTVPSTQSVLQRVEALPGVRAAAPRLYGYALLGGEVETQGAQLLGVDPGREGRFIPYETRMVAGRWLTGNPGEIVLGEGLARKLRAEVGGQVVALTQAADGSLGNELYDVVGVLSSGSMMADRSGAWLSLADLQALLVLPDQAHELILLGPSAEPRQGDPKVLGLLQDLRGVIDASLLVRPWWEVSPATAQMMATTDGSAWISMAIIFAVAGLGVLNTMLMSVFERTRELGVMAALGTRPRTLVALVLWESLLLGGLACGAGVSLGLALDLLLVRRGVNMTANGERISSMGVLFDPIVHGVIRPDRIVASVLMLLLVAVLAALWPAIRAARLRPVQAMRVDA